MGEDVNPRECRKCGVPILDGYVEDVLPARLNRSLLTREEARAWHAAGWMVVSLYVRAGEVVESAFWDPLRGEKWRHVLEHKCERQRDL